MPSRRRIPNPEGLVTARERNFTCRLTACWEPNEYTRILRNSVVFFRPGSELQIRTGGPSEETDSVLISYIPTPPEIVDAMLELAEVGEKDIVYDLGCGDGRIVFAAVRKFGVQRAVGIDIDTDLIEACRESARSGGFEDRVEFYNSDVLDIADLSAASVVTVYMGEMLNPRLVPLLRNTLRPGSRIVSHRFLLGDFEPERAIMARGNDGLEYILLLWRV